MTFRDDRDGLRMRVRELEAEITDLRKQLRLARDADVAAMRREVERAGAEVERLKSRPALFIPGVLVGFVVGMGVGMYVIGAFG